MLIVIFFYESSENRGIPFRDVWSEISGEFSKLENFRRLRFEEVDVFLPFFFFLFQITHERRIMPKILISRCSIFHHRYTDITDRESRSLLSSPPSSNTRHLILVPFVQSIRERYTLGYAAMIRVISLEERSHSNTSLPYWSSRNSGYRRDAA